MPESRKDNDPHEWLDKHIENQKHNADIIRGYTETVQEAASRWKIPYDEAERRLEEISAEIRPS